MDGGVWRAAVCRVTENQTWQSNLAHSMRTEAGCYGLNVCVFLKFIYWRSNLQIGASLVAQMARNLPATRETQVWSPGWEDFLEKGMATYSSSLAWKMHRQESLLGYSPRGHKESDTTEWLTLKSSNVIFGGLQGELFTWGHEGRALMI